MAPCTAARPAAWGASPLATAPGPEELLEAADSVAWVAELLAAVAAAEPPPTELATCAAWEAWADAVGAAMGVFAAAAPAAAATAWAAAYWAICWASVPCTCV